jgi:hypothetical protein
MRYNNLISVSSQDFTDYGCVAVAVLSHSSECGFVDAKDMQYSEQELLKYLKVSTQPTLITKPRIVMIQVYF